MINADMILFLVTILLIAYWLIWRVDWDAVEERAKRKWQHTFLSDAEFKRQEKKDFETMMKKLKVPPYIGFERGGKDYDDSPDESQ